VNGETHLYLGKQYRLKLAEGTENSVKLSRGFFHITCRNEPTPNAANKLLNQWYSEKAQLQFTESMDRCRQKFNGLGIDQPKLSIKRMQKRWGSLSGKGTVTLNTYLIRAPKECIDYVVTHELCHLKYHDHSPEFYKLLDSVIPGWEKIKHKLELSMEYPESKEDGLLCGRYRLGDLIKQKGRTFRYLYDFGDSWEHELVLEESRYFNPELRTELACLEGERACPPEDVGGIPGYFEFCNALKNPSHDQ
jgi:predicted metal-dependent hydrolase